MNFYIWSNEHQAWWKPASNGYTTDRNEAGIYEKSVAVAICYNANSYQKVGEVPNEMLVPTIANLT